jgi:hypothetical protein
VVEDCRSLSFTDGTPIELVAMHSTLDLALLSSPRRSRNWIAVHRTGVARLGQRVIALSYPFYGSLTTALNSTGGNVSATVGLGDDPRLVTVTAPIHPGNSGGPLLALDGTVIGVVVATINKIAWQRIPPRGVFVLSAEPRRAPPGRYRVDRHRGSTPFGSKP